jgi:hypothetical protein
MEEDGDAPVFWITEAPCRALTDLDFGVIPITNKIRYKILVKYQRNGRIKHGTTQN